jgi:alpha-beta hydrolase superfamily lysophospholipase
MKRPDVVRLALGSLLGMAGTLGGMLGVAWYASSRLNPVPRRTYLDGYTFTPWELAVPYEELTLRTPDGLALRAWWLPRPETPAVVLGCHGHTGRKDDLLGIGSGLWRAGYNVLLFDLRGRGESDAAPNTLAGREVADVLAAVAYARARMPEASVGIVGFSMGAAVALLAAAREPHIAAVVADSPFTSAFEILVEQMQQSGAGAAALPLAALTDRLTAYRYGYSPSRVRPIDAARQLSPRPLLLVHGSHDTLIPLAHAHRMFAAAHEPKELWIYEGVEHCGAYFADRCTYVERVSTFFNRYLRSTPQAD